MKDNPKAKHPYPLWNKYTPELADGFRHLCGYSAMWVEEGTVDHYLSWKNRPDLAYEWSNYRFASDRMNKSKQNEDDRILDPYLVQDGWFEILLPSLMLVLTPDVPVEHRARAEYTLKRLGLRDSEPILRRRQKWYDVFRNGNLTLAGLRVFAPLIARAVDQRLERINPHAFEDEQACYRQFEDGRLTLQGLRRDAPRIAQAIDDELAQPRLPKR